MRLMFFYGKAAIRAFAGVQTQPSQVSTNYTRTAPRRAHLFIPVRVFFRSLSIRDNVYSGCQSIC